MEMNARLWSGFAALCLLSGSGWILSEFWISPVSGLTGVALHDAVLCLLFWFASQRFEASKTSSTPWIFIAAWGATLLALPQVLFAAADGAVSVFSVVLIYTLVPVIVVVFVGQRAGFGIQESTPALLGPALAGVAGAALLLPFTLPGSTAGVLWFIVMVMAAVLAGIAAVKLHSLLENVEIFRTLTIVSAAVAGLSLAFALVKRTPMKPASPKDVAIELASCLFLDGPVLLLTVWLLRTMSPVAFSSRYLFVPLVTIVEGFILVRPTLNWTAVGAMLLAGGGLALMNSGNAGRESVPISRTNQP
jgi:drug/metabolite transporter (DMT)-like permease